MSARTIFPLTAVVARRNVTAMGTAGAFDDDFREVKRVDADGDGLGAAQRIESTSVTFKAQVENDRYELQRMTGAGDMPDIAVGLVVSLKEMAAAGLYTSGVLQVRKTDRLVQIKDKDGMVAQDYSLVNAYCTHVQYLNAFLRRRVNLALLVFADRAQGVTG